jgi:RHS repeat-associated protein
VMTHYDGPTIHTDRTVAGEVRRRSETKNILGKVAEVVTWTKENGVPRAIHITYTYDADGNLKRTLDPNGNMVEITYDNRGRKTASVDPDMGSWSYGYDGFGDLISQSHSKGGSTMRYDPLGRMISKDDGSGEAQWVYDLEPGGVGQLAGMISAPDDRLNAPCNNVEHITLSGGNRSGRSYKYTPFGELRQTTECVDGDSFITDHHYDTFGREDVITYPQVGDHRFAVGYNYNAFGYLHFLADPSGNSVYWAATTVNPMGQVTEEYTGNNVLNRYDRNEATGWLRNSFSRARSDGWKTIQNWTYYYDELGTLRWRGRSDDIGGPPSEERFEYDPLNRLLSSHVAVGLPSTGDVMESYAYDDLGNLTRKGGDIYTYGTCGAGPHAVCAAGSRSFQYDTNGNMSGGGGRTIAYNNSNRATQITAESGPIIKFIYGADNHRVVQDVGAGSSAPASRTVYVGLGATGRSLYERTTRPSGTEHVQFVYAGGIHGGNAFALRVVSEATPPTGSMQYYHRDNLGSVTAMSDGTGKVHDISWGPEAGVMGYDPWGARRNPSGTPANAAFNQQVGRREFTGHETIPVVGLVNMNGRMYDPTLGRFLSPDPNVQFVADLQSYNRYSYVLNNPLTHTDPTGYFSLGDFGSLVNIAWTFAGIAACSGTVGAGCPAFFAISGAVFNSAVMAAQGASFEQVLIVNAVGIASGQLGGEIGKAAASAVGEGFGAQIVGGVISGAVSSAYSTAALGGNLGENVLRGAAHGAAWAAVSYAFHPTPLSQAANSEPRHGGGSGAAQVEKAETVEDYLASEGYRGIGREGDAPLLRARPGVFVVSIKPEFKGTAYIGAAAGAQLGPVGYARFVGLAIDENGDVGFVWGWQAVGGVSARAYAGLQLQLSNAATIDDLSGYFSTVSNGVGLGDYASADGFWGSSDHGPVHGVGATYGVGAGGGAVIGRSYTHVERLRLWDRFGDWVQKKFDSWTSPPGYRLP